jgi:predicted permease
MAVWNSINLVLKIFILIKVGYLLFLTNLYPESYPLQLLNWWIYFLIFDIWVSSSFKFLKNDDETK